MLKILLNDPENSNLNENLKLNKIKLIENINNLKNNIKIQNNKNSIEKEEIDNYKKEINNLNLKITELNRNKEKDFLTYATSIANLDVMLNGKIIEMNKLEKENNSIKSQIDDLKKLIIEKEQKNRDSNIKISNIKKNINDNKDTHELQKLKIQHIKDILSYVKKEDFTTKDLQRKEKDFNIIFSKKWKMQDSIDCETGSYIIYDKVKGNVSVFGNTPKLGDGERKIEYVEISPNKLLIKTEMLSNPFLTKLNNGNIFVTLTSNEYIEIIGNNKLKIKYEYKLLDIDRFLNDNNDKIYNNSTETIFRNSCDEINEDNYNIEITIKDDNKKSIDDESVTISDNIEKENEDEIMSEKYVDASTKKICKKEWTKRGELDTNMFEFCKKTNEDDYEEYKVFFQKNRSESFFKLSNKHCRNYWTKRDVVDISMVIHCLNREKEGYLDIKYIISKHGIDAENKSKEFFSKYKDYSTTAYRLNKLFDNK